MKRNLPGAPPMPLIIATALLIAAPPVPALAATTAAEAEHMNGRFAAHILAGLLR